MTSLLISRRNLCALAAGTALGLPHCADDPAATTPGSAAPAFALEDIQPLSEFIGKRYGLEQFRGSVTLVALLAAWCNTCLGTAVKLRELEARVRSEGFDARFVAINKSDAGAVGLQRQLTDAAGFAVLQDVDAVDAWGKLAGTRNDLYLYRPDSRLRAYYELPARQDVNPVTTTGFAHLRQALYDAR